MDYTKLATPYGKDPSRQRFWLVKKHGVPPTVADAIMAEVYAEIDAGAAYPDGDELDKALLHRSEAREKEAYTAAVIVAQTSVEKIIGERMKRDRMVPRRNRTQWSAGAFVLGLALGAAGLWAVQWWLS